MSSTHIQCGDCGTVIDSSADTQINRVPCPACGSLKRAVHLSAGPMQMSKYTLDKFVAHKLSGLTRCGAKEINNSVSYLNAFILNNIFGSAPLDDKMRAYAFNFIRRAEGAFASYREARFALIEYVETPPNLISPYFRALLNFETFLAQVYQGYELLRTASGIKYFEKGDQSDGERLNKLYNDSKHMDRKIERGELPPRATAGLWITNDGLESGQAKLSFVEIAEILSIMDKNAKKLSGSN